jgi:hypothetical protein
MQLVRLADGDQVHELSVASIPPGSPRPHVGADQLEGPRYCGDLAELRVRELVIHDREPEPDER